MNEDELEERLRTYHAADPSVALRTRVLANALEHLGGSGRRQSRLRWWWIASTAGAAIAMIAAAVATEATYRSIATVVTGVTGSPQAGRERLLAALAADLGGPDALDRAERMIRSSEDDMARYSPQIEATQ